MNFNSESKKVAEKALLDIDNANKAAAKAALYKKITYGVGVIILFILLIVILRKSGKKPEETTIGIDTIIGDIPPKQQELFPAIEFEVNDKKSNMEKQVKKYAAEKPEQVADIIKSWLTEDER